MRNKLRPLSAVLLLDKPSGPTSNAVLQHLKRLYRADKAGHTGSLDPLASGLLPVCFGEATKLSTYLLTGDKGYRTIARMGIRTETLDATGRPLSEVPIGDLSSAQIERELATFRGEIEQVPPMYSALKRGGMPLYSLARQGVDVDREPRRVRVDRLQIVEWTPPFLVLDIDCTSGTYVRSLIDDLGNALGCGAHVHSLRRTWAAPFRQPQMHTLADIDAQTGAYSALDAFLMPIESMLGDLPQVRITADDLVAFSHGNPVCSVNVPNAGAIAVLDSEGMLLGIARCSDGRTLKAVRVLNR